MKQNYLQTRPTGNTITDTQLTEAHALLSDGRLHAEFLKNRRDDMETFYEKPPVIQIRHDAPVNMFAA